MRITASLVFSVAAAALVAQAPVPSLSDRVKTERVVVEQLMAEFKYPEAMQRADRLLPATKPTFDKTDNNTMVAGCTLFLDLAAAHRLATEAADAAGEWEKALGYARTAQALVTECYDGSKEPFERMVAYYTQAGVRAKQVLQENDARIKELKAKASLDPGERQELDLALSVEKEVVDSAKWMSFFQTFLDVTKRESKAYDPLVKLLETNLKSEADQVADYKAGKGEVTKWVEAVISTPAYLESQGSKAGQAHWLYRLAKLDPDNKKVLHQLDVLQGKAPAAAAKHVKKGKKA